MCNYDKDDVGGVGDNNDHGHRGDRRVQEEMQEWERMDLVEMMHNQTPTAQMLALTLCNVFAENYILMHVTSFRV